VVALSVVCASGREVTSGENVIYVKVLIKTLANGREFRTSQLWLVGNPSGIIIRFVTIIFISLHNHRYFTQRKMPPTMATKIRMATIRFPAKSPSY